MIIDVKDEQCHLELAAFLLHIRNKKSKLYVPIACESLNHLSIQLLHNSLGRQLSESQEVHLIFKMTFWQENYSFIKEVYDTRYSKMVEWMDNVEMAIQKVCASKVYTSAEFKREKDNFHVSLIYGLSIY